MRPRVTFDEKGIEAWMRENLVDDVHARTEAVAESVRAEASSDVTVDFGTTDRPVGVVMHHFAYASEVKHARLARAAVAHGLQLGPPGRARRGKS